jgi:hypothetical protein
MNDPHIQALHYRIRHADSVDFDNAPPLEHNEPEFAVRLEKGRATVTMKNHHSNAESARTAVEPFLQAWELSAALLHDRDKFEFSYENCDVIDRKPIPGAIRAAAAIAVGVGSAVALHAHVGRGSYPPPPIGLARDVCVDLMLDRYRMYCEGRTTLSDAGNYCLTALALARSRGQAAAHFAIANTVLNKLGTLTAEKGGKEARKAKAAGSDYTPAERTWLQETLKTIIRRAAEVANNPDLSYKQITLADLPSIPR